MSFVIMVTDWITLPHAESGEINFAAGEYTARALPNTHASGFWGLYDAQGNFVGNAAMKITKIR